MKFRSMFKVRKPGNGDKFQKKVESDGHYKLKVTNKDNSQNSGPKTSIK